MKTCQEFILGVGIATIVLSLREDNFKYSSTSLYLPENLSIYLSIYLFIYLQINLYIVSLL